MIYFDNGATGGFKPRTVTDMAENVIKYLCANPGRGGHRLSTTGSELVYKTRCEISEVFNANPSRVIFTKNCTEGLNTVILGKLKENDHVITTFFEHNSVLRPLSYLKKTKNIQVDYLDLRENPKEKLREKIKSNTAMIISTGASNVTGEILPFKEIGEFAKENNIPFLLDGAQLGGHVAVDMVKDNISFMCLSGHKGLYGIMGSGILILNENEDVSPLTFGGTGTDSLNLSQPEEYPEKLESGTLNLPAICALYEGVKYASRNLDGFNKVVFENTAKLIDELNNIQGITVISKPNKIGIVSFSVNGFSSQEVADILNKEYDVAVRGGYHCSPLTHKYLNTFDGGLVRVSLAVQNTTYEIREFVKAIKNIAKSF